MTHSVGGIAIGFASTHALYDLISLTHVRVSSFVTAYISLLALSAFPRMHLSDLFPIAMASKGDIISFFDSDDYAHPSRHVLLLSEFQSNPHLDALVHGFQRLTAHGDGGRPKDVINVSECQWVARAYLEPQDRYPSISYLLGVYRLYIPSQSV